MRYIALLDHGPNWAPDRTHGEQDQPIADHLDAMCCRSDAGTIVLGGSCHDGGGIAILETPNETTARTILDNHPAVKAGLLSYTLHGLPLCSRPTPERQHDQRASRRQAHRP